jgi:hypothetical protein
MKEEMARIVNYAIKDLYLGPMDASIIGQGAPLKENFDEAYANNYFQLRRDGRKAFVTDLERNFKLETLNFCSIGCGFGGEESLLEDKVNKLVLVEPDQDTFLFLQKKFRSKKAILVNNLIEDYNPDLIFDFIYASSVSSWMYSSPWHGIPHVYIQFVNRHLSTNGIFIARIYGGLHSAQVIVSKAYLQILVRCLEKAALKVLIYLYNSSGVFLIVNREKSKLMASDLAFSEPGTIMIKDGQLIDYFKISTTEKIRRFIGLLVYLPVIILCDRTKKLRNIVDLAKINLKLLQS